MTCQLVAVDNVAKASRTGRSAGEKLLVFTGREKMNVADFKNPTRSWDALNFDLGGDIGVHGICGLGGT